MATYHQIYDLVRYDGETESQDFSSIIESVKQLLSEARLTRFQQNELLLILIWYYSNNRLSLNFDTEQALDYLNQVLMVPELSVEHRARATALSGHLHHVGPQTQPPLADSHYAEALECSEFRPDFKMQVLEWRANLY